MIFITGPHNSGKTTLALQLLQYGFLHIETGDIKLPRVTLGSISGTSNSMETSILL